MPLRDTAREELRDLATRYPDPRSAVLPMLHLVQAEQGHVTAEGVEACAEVLGLAAAEVAAVATFYTMFKRRPVGRHHIGVCTNALCAVLGGDDVYAAVSERLGVGHDEPTPDGEFWLERIECQAACTHAPVMTVDWEFLDRQTPASAVEVIDRLAAGEPVTATRGPQVRDFQATERTLAFPDDGLVDAGGGADDLMLVGLRTARERGMSAPPPPAPTPAKPAATPPAPAPAPGQEA